MAIKSEPKKEYKKLATFTWSWTVQVETDFDRNNPEQYQKALDAAYVNIQKSDGELTDLQDE